MGTSGLAESTIALLIRYGSDCVVQQVTTTRTATNGVTETVIEHTGRAYKQMATKEIIGQNPNVSAKLILITDDGYIVKTKDRIVLAGNANQALMVHTVQASDSLLYQVVLI